MNKLKSKVIVHWCEKLVLQEKQTHPNNDSSPCTMHEYRWEPKPQTRQNGTLCSRVALGARALDLSPLLLVKFQRSLRMFVSHVCGSYSVRIEQGKGLLSGGKSFDPDG